MKGFWNWLFKKEEQTEYFTPTIKSEEPMCYICEKGEPATTFCEVDFGNGQIVYHNIYAHKECVKNLICNADFGAEIDWRLETAMGLVKQWKRDEEAKIKRDDKLKNELIDCIDYLCKEDNK